MKYYSKEFKEQALTLSNDIGLKKAVEQLGIKYNTLSDWRKQRNKKNNTQVTLDTNALTEREMQFRLTNNSLSIANFLLK